MTSDNKKSIAEMATLTKNISNLVSGLEKHHRKHNKNEKWLVVSTIILALATVFLGAITYLLWETDDQTSRRDAAASERNEKMRQTISLCENFYSWYGDYGNILKDSLLQNLKHWAKNDSTWQSFDSVRATKYFTELEEKRVVNKLFHYFENAKMLDKDSLLDRSYFINFFSIWFKNLKCTENPKIDEWLSRVRAVSGQSAFDGYEYCLKTVLALDSTFVKEYREFNCQKTKNRVK